MKRAVVVFLCAVLGAAFPRAAGVQQSSIRSDAGRRPIADTDLLAFTWVADPQISPDGSTIAFVRVVVNERDNRYETAIYLVPASGAEAPRALTAGIRDTSPRWSPDGKRLAFVRVVERDGRPQAGQVYLLQMTGGEARALTDLPRGVGAPVWSPDGRTIAFTSTTVAGDLTPPSTGERKSDVRVMTRPEYRANGNPDYIDPDRPQHIWTVAAEDVDVDRAGRDVLDGLDRAAPRPITDGAYDERNPEWARDGSTIYFVSNRTDEPYYHPDDSDLYGVPAAGGPIVRIASIDGTIGRMAVSHDGARIAFVGTLNGNPIRSYNVPDLWVTETTPGARPRNLTEDYAFDINGGIGGDQAAPRGAAPKGIVWSADDRSLLVVASEHGSANLKRVSLAGRIDPITAGPQDVMAFTGAADGATIAAVISSPRVVGDLAVVNAGSSGSPGSPGSPGSSVARPATVTHFNDSLFGRLDLTLPEEISYASFDGKRIQGWILKPPDFDPKRRYPMILQIHGGPHSAYGNTFTHEFAWMAAKGYVVLFTNPRGSSSYGQDFGNIIQYRYPGDDYKDLMAGVDEVLERGYVDPERLGVTGGSGGGLLTNWTITQTGRFKAAVSQRDIADWAGFWYSADFNLFQPFWFRKAPWEDPRDFAARSPITHVANVTTPLMLVLGDQDYRTPPGDGGEQMFRALKYRRIPTVMVRFPRENHELSRSGEPWHRIERLRHIVGWMDRWLSPSS